ncbi:uncharacterized protein LOC112344046 [Selaginella moellendorffii]|uniref:uncharacterized protein LOC112344046 n=1 Tax=Selaginella moellendorffii TaxID=88036 RepID=UPI000D1C9073|nr:uncharacterized protein LOC112344046 [Selaginella moellendorffii]XP_024523940.1 uncharacterized protein LOC112344046 [Selaginella moellendorffii]|eukprot:XP_024523939.1 uncharacterized protein LOC112344046 [Selaginella moellendorffii]
MSRNSSKVRLKANQWRNGDPKCTLGDMAPDIKLRVISESPEFWVSLERGSNQPTGEGRLKLEITRHAQPEHPRALGHPLALVELPYRNGVLITALYPDPGYRHVAPPKVDEIVGDRNVALVDSNGPARWAHSPEEFPIVQAEQQRL